MFEYGVKATYAEGLHRGPWTKEEATAWVQEWKDMCSHSQIEAGMGELFYVVRRQVGEWERDS